MKIFSHQFLCIALFQRQKLPSKWHNFPGMRFPDYPLFQHKGCFLLYVSITLWTHYACLQNKQQLGTWTATSLSLFSTCLITFGVFDFLFVCLFACLFVVIPTIYRWDGSKRASGLCEIFIFYCLYINVVNRTWSS